MKILKLILISLVVLAVADALYSHFHTERVVIRSAYNWTSSLDFPSYGDSPDSKFASSHGVKRIYVKMIDVGWSQQVGISPNSVIQNFRYSDTSYDYVPVAFIENLVFANIDSARIDLLCINVMRHLMRIEGYVSSLKEYQIDCDWNASTRKNYFQFLRRMQLLRPQYTISATLRLYQVKYPEKAGIPPVDRGMLMMYNIGDATKLSPTNSIFDADLAEEYLTGKSYPLPLDFALPTFSWGLFYRNGKLLGVKSNVSIELCESLSFLKKTEDEDIFIVKKDTVWEGSLLRYGDIVKPENCYDEILKQSAGIAEKFCNTDTLHIAIFDLDTFDLNNIRHESIEKAFNTFR